MNSIVPENADFPSPSGDSAHAEEFVRLFSEHQRDLLKFIFLLVPIHAEAEDILQETSVILWRKFGEFQRGTDFFRWAAQVARFKVRDFRKKTARDRHRFWTDDLIEAIAETRLTENDSLMQQRNLLAACMQKLTTIDRELIQSVFRQGTSIKMVAECLGRPVNTVYKALNRIRKTLLDCVERAKRQEGRLS
jgi:RNA polymerase sigma-70 factor, ECF subfamily